MRSWALALTTLAIASLGFAASAQAYVYWTNQFDNAIGRANLDGTNADQSFIVGATTPHGVAVDGAHVYWTNANGTIGRANLDGTNAAQSFIVAPLSDQGSGVAVDGSHIYWVSSFGGGPGAGAIGRANLDGTGVEPNFISGISRPAGGVVVDGSHVYWTSYDPANPFIVLNGGALPTRIGRANLNGTGVEESFISTVPTQYGVAVDAAYIWWSHEEPRGTGATPSAASILEDGIRRAALDGTGAEVVIPSGEFSSCGGLALGDTHVYWTQAGSIGRARLDGSRGTGELFDARPNCGGVDVDALGPPPSNEFSLGGAKKETERGSAELTVRVVGPGELQLAKTAQVKGASIWAAHAGKVKLAVKPRGSAKERLQETGRAKVAAKVAYTPDGGTAAAATTKIELVKR
jgi:hypothetical protein